MCRVQYTVCSLQCVVCSVGSGAACSGQSVGPGPPCCAHLSATQCETSICVHSIQCTVNSVQCTVYSVQCTVNSDTSQFTVYRLKCSVTCTICLVKQWFCEIFSCETRTVRCPPVLWVTVAKIEQHLSSSPSLHSVLHH